MTEFPKNYDFEAIEARWYEIWVQKGLFKPGVNPEGKPYSIVIPPPNVTGSLHMGHALNATIQDILIRRQRMLGNMALWIPGTDHAGIATQNVVERQLEKQGADRHKLGRDAFIDRVWEWKAEYGGRITLQLKRLGASCDWSRERFTLDDGLSKAVREVFVRLYDEGLIYRDNKLINWCPRCRTALSDLEVEHDEIEGTLTYIKYPFSDGTGHLTVATTRPETMLGDTAVAVNPKDERYKALIGKMLKLPLTNREIPLIADETVDREFATGALKVTPSHDFNDEATGKRHGLPSLSVIGPDGLMNENAGEKYVGLDRYKCRKAVIEDLRALDLIVDVTPHKHSVGHCYRCKSIIEPLSTLQWYIKIAPLAKPAIEAVRNGSINIVPEGWKNNYYGWMEDIKDWCISRQIWWGHRIPVWYCKDCQEINVATETPAKCKKCSGTNLEQDPDVLDTWFSSALWPFSTLGWPHRGEDLKAFYPTSVLVTAFDILFFWVARMIMLGLKFMGEVPFKDVYIHAIVRDSDGQKMSKSKGNVIDPLTIIDKYGADAFRFTLAAFAAQGRDIRFSMERVEGYKFFINKLWNATRYILDYASAEEKDSDSPTLASRWILARLATTADEVNSSLEAYRFNDAASSIYHFVWHEYCDWYIEMSKTEMSNKVTEKTLKHVLDNILRLLHPFMPFVTEEIWQKIAERGGLSIVTSSYPQSLHKDPEAEISMSYIMDTIDGIRNIKGELNIPPSMVVNAVVKTATNEIADILKYNLHYIKKLARTDEVEIGRDIEKPKGSATFVKGSVEVYLPLEGLLDISAELSRLAKEQQKVEESISFAERKLSNEDFVKKAPQAVIEKERQKITELREKGSKLLESIERMKNLKGRQ